MKILQFVCDGAPGGGTNHVFQLLTGLSRPTECVLLTQQDSYLEQKARDSGIRTFGGDFFRGRLDRRCAGRIAEVIEEVQPDMIHCHGGRAAFYYSRVSKRLKTNRPSFYTVHGFHFNRKSLLPRVLGWGGEYVSIRACDNIIFVADYDHKIAVDKRLLPPDKSFQVIHNGIEEPVLDFDEDQANLGVGFVGRMVFQKNPQLFVEVMKHLPDQVGVMGGDGVLEPEVKDLVNQNQLSQRLCLLGGLTHQEALRTISRLDVLVMTPRWEGLPLLPLEAMFLGIPVVSTPVGGIPEIIRHGFNGMLGDSAEELASHVQRLQRDALFREQIVMNARETVAREFSQASMLNKLEAYYHRVYTGRCEGSTVMV